MESQLGHNSLTVHVQFINLFNTQIVCEWCLNYFEVFVFIMKAKGKKIVNIRNIQYKEKFWVFGFP